MGQQISQNGALKRSANDLDLWNGKLSPKTNFFYIHPLKCENEQHPYVEEDTPQTQQEIQKIAHQTEYWEIQNNQEQPTVNTVEEIGKIQEIKVRWNEFIKMKKRNYLEDYSVLKQIGRGGFGCVHKVKARYTGLYRAAKRIKKAQLKKAQHQKLFQEMAIMMSLDHPNIAKLYQVYDYKSYYVLILELCEGGELFKKIVTKQLTEETTARTMKQILWTLIYLHKKGIVHRDLKPQNMMFQQDSDIIKIIDFGIAVKKKSKDEILTARLGTPYYIAPQVLCKSYGEKCDIWSAGVILFMMISGYPPFRGQNQYEVMECVLKENVQFKGNFHLNTANIWSRVSADCKNLISWMLKKNPDERPSAEEAFNHPWIKKVVDKTPNSAKEEENVIANIRDFSFQNKLQAVVYTYIVSQLFTSEEKKFLFQAFKEIDKNNDGVIESSELYEALKDKKDISEDRVKMLMRIIDTNGSGQIDYTEFLVAGIDSKNCLTEHHFEQAFAYFDIDHSGAITFEEIAHFLEDTKESEDSIKKIFQQVDQNNDGNISKEEFVKLLMHDTKKRIVEYYERQNQEKKNKPKTAKNIHSPAKSAKGEKDKENGDGRSRTTKDKSDKENSGSESARKREPGTPTMKTSAQKNCEQKSTGSKITSVLKHKEQKSEKEAKTQKKVTIMA